MTSKVSVLIPYYNPGAYIVDAVNSVFSQTYTDWQLILIDDASTDNTEALLEECLKDPRVRMIRHTENSGQSKSMNTGLALVETPFIIQLDADDWFFPYTLEVLLRTAEAEPDEGVAVFSGNMNVVFEKNRKRKLAIKKDAFKRTYRTMLIKGKQFLDRYDFLLSNQSIWPRFYRTLALRSIGGWPTDDPFEGRYAEDIRVLFRLLENYRFHWVDELLLNHRRHPHNQTNQTELYGKIIEWAVRDALRRWGDQFDPIFSKTEQGWTIISQLIKKQTSN